MPWTVVTVLHYCIIFTVCACQSGGMYNMCCLLYVYRTVQILSFQKKKLIWERNCSRKDIFFLSFDCCCALQISIRSWKLVWTSKSKTGCHHAQFEWHHWMSLNDTIQTASTYLMDEHWSLQRFFFSQMNQRHVKKIIIIILWNKDVC